MKPSTEFSDTEIEFVSSKNCRVCKAKDMQRIISFGRQPLANSLLVKPGAPSPTAPLELVRCGMCGTVQLGVDINPGAMFSQYLWVTGTSSSSVSHCKWVAEQTLSRVCSEPKSVLEVASNDGTLLKFFKESGLTTLGIDPAENLAEIANGQEIRTLPDYFSSKLALDLVASQQHFDIVIARNVLSHVPDPADVIQGMATALSPDGVVVVEFHRADVILEGLHYDSVYHEHSLYQSLKSMIWLLELAGLQAFDLAPSPISGGSWIVFAAHKNQSRKVESVVPETLAHEARAGVADDEPWNDFGRRVMEHRQQVLDFLRKEEEGLRKVVAFGASARSSTLLNFWFEKGGNTISAILDSNPLKQGLFSPGLAIPILSPAEGLRGEPDTVLILAFNFEEEIRSLLKASGWAGRVATVLPHRLRVEEFGMET